MVVAFHIRNFGLHCVWDTSANMEEVKKRILCLKSFGLNHKMMWNGRSKFSLSKLIILNRHARKMGNEKRAST